MKFKLEVEKKDLHVTDKINDVEKNFIRLATYELENLISKKTPVDTGDLRSSWHHSIEAHEGRIYTSKSYARYVEEGTGVHGPKGAPITPHSGSYLRFKPHKGDYSEIMAQDGYVYIRQSQGQKPAHMVKDSLEEIDAELPKIIAQAIRKAEG